MNLLSAFGGGLWLIPLGLLIGAVWSAYRGIKYSSSGSQQQTGGGQTYSDKNVPFHKTGAGLFSIILFVLFIGAVIWMISEK